MNKKRGKCKTPCGIKHTYNTAGEAAGSISGEACAEVVSAVELDSKMMDKIKKYMGRAAGHDVSLKNKVDSSIIGGLVINIGEKVIDLSVSSRLEDIRARLKAVDLGGEGFGA
jgi:F-type H+-transporting ATPase subunit delta